MHRLRLIYILLLFSINLHASYKVDSLLIELDRAIKNSEVYRNKREDRINNLKKEKLEIAEKSIELYHKNKEIFEEYKSYISDSAIIYLNHNIELAKDLNKTELEHESCIQLAYLYGSMAMFFEAVDILSDISVNQLSKELKTQYYIALDKVYGELALYTLDAKRSEEYTAISNTYKDSLLFILPNNHEQYLTLDFFHKLYYLSDTKEARKVSEELLSKEEFGKGRYALMAYYQALTYKQEGDRINEKCYLASSALSDIYTATKDHASLWMLAQILFEEGNNLERANNYINYSWSATAFYNSQLRSRQSSGILSHIDNAYQETIKNQNKKLQYYLYSISLLSLLLIIALFYIYKQIKRLSTARINLQQVNNRLKAVNKDLSESNHIKDEYIGRFINLSSSYIDKLDAYRRKVNRHLSSGKIEELKKMIRSTESLETELQNLYSNFDNAFLQIFPDYVHKFNSLLKEEHHIVPKKGELLTTELRIFALIRIGIEDSSQIAEFLRYSVNTIYNYRAKVKNYAVGSREEFESDVKKIR